MKRPYWHTIQLEEKEDTNFEAALHNWIDVKVKCYPRSILVFNYKYINTNDEKTNLSSNKRACNAELSGMEIKYLRVTESMCILLKAMRNRKHLYKIPETWDRADFWYMY